jgi:hypothetical protein
MTMLEEHQAQLQGMLASRYIMAVQREVEVSQCFQAFEESAGWW